MAAKDHKRPLFFDGLRVIKESFKPISLRNIASSVRDFLRFAQQQGWIRQRLDLTVPKIACGAQNDLPVYLSGQ
jgi:hypothetical protein